MRFVPGMWSTLIGLACAACLGAQSPVQLRALFFQRDFESGYRAGLAAVAATASPEFHAWFVANEARYGLVDEAMAAADSIAPQSPWRDFARVVALCEGTDRRSAIPLARHLAATQPTRSDFLWAYAYALLSNGRYLHVVSALDSARRQGVGDNAELGALEGNALALLTFGPDGDSTMRSRARAAFADARRRDSTNVDVYYFEGAHLTDGPSDSGAAARLARAAALSPFAPSVHSAYWDALARLRHNSDSATRNAIARDIGVILAGRGTYSGALYLAATGYQMLDSTEHSTALNERILLEYPTSYEADKVRLDRILAYRDSLGRRTATDSAVAVRQYRAQLEAFLRGPGHHERSMLGSAYLTLFASESRDTSVTNDALIHTVHGMVRYDALNPQWTHVLAPRALADRHVALPYAEGLARDGESVLRRYYADFFASINPRETEQLLALALSAQSDALGWVYFSEGRLADAARTLTRARALDRLNPLPYYHMGRLAEARGRLDTARARYARGYQLELTRRYAGTSNGDALRRLYEARRGSGEGFDAYLDTLREQDRRLRHAAIAASRLSRPAPVRPFKLDPLGDGPATSSDSLHGKVVVLHFWGTWCGACVAELPDFERWYESVRGDTSVVVVTIDYSDDQRTVRRFAEQHHLLFPVLVDDGYVDKVKVQAFPTTWFIDRTGHLAFTGEGMSEALGEEFGWRIDMLRN